MSSASDFSEHIVTKVDRIPSGRELLRDRMIVLAEQAEDYAPLSMAPAEFGDDVDAIMSLDHRTFFAELGWPTAAVL